MHERSGALSWVHFGDLHIQRPEDENYSDFLELVDQVNQNVGDTVDFAFLPGDNADGGTAEQYELVREGVRRLKLPVHIITGDHDRKTGTLDAFRHYLEPRVFRSLRLERFVLMFLNAMDAADPKTFDLGAVQWDWLIEELAAAEQAGLRPLLFTHVYPSQLATKGRDFPALLRRYKVEFVDMGHTHYNELANDGQTIYAATRSTGQIEEGVPGFSVTTIERDVISWKFKGRGEWPFAMIKSPSDYRLITDSASPRHVLRGPGLVKAEVWGSMRLDATCSIAGSTPQRMGLVNGSWECEFDWDRLSNGVHSVRVEAQAEDGRTAHDEIWACVNAKADYTPPARAAVDRENRLGAWPEKGILGTQLGPNENGTKGPWPSWRGR